MNCRIALFAATLFAAGVSLAPRPADAAMPLPGAAAADAGGDLVLVASKKKKSARQKEIDRSVESGTVPARYRSRVPKEYQQYVPFEQSKGKQ